VVGSAPLNACRKWTAAVRRYLTASPSTETNWYHRTTEDGLLDQAKAENFAVAAAVLPPSIRRHLLTVYLYARLVDDIGDEAEGNRVALLDEVSADLDRIYSGAPPVHRALAGLPDTVAACRIPRAPLDALIAANRQDQVVSRYPAYADLLAYCELSANPVGVLVLHVFGQCTPRHVELSDKVCTALQILEHCQDVVEDQDNGRIYLPQEDLERFGVEESALKAPRADARVRALLAFQVQRARRLLEEGAPLVGSLRGLGKLAVGGYLAGGLATADAIAAANYDVLVRTPKPAKPNALRHWGLLLATGGAR
jgi:squalene synthase HpnC